MATHHGNAKPCVCGHNKSHHKSGRNGCFVWMSSEDRTRTVKCPCEQFQAARRDDDKPSAGK